MKHKRNLTVGLLALSAVLGAGVVGAAQENKHVSALEPTDITASVVKGDVNEDGTIDVKDAILASQYIAGAVELSANQQMAADVADKDNDINARDIIRICQHIAGLKVDFEWACKHDNPDVVVTDPTCTEGGYTTYTCTNCGYVYVTEYTDALGHKPGKAHWENEVAPTCTADGSYDTVVKCTVCGEDLSREPGVIPATGHTYGEWVTTKEPTCTEQGTRERSCQEGDDTQSEPIAELGHIYKNGVCTRCGGKESNEQTETHTYGEWTTVKEPSCTESGKKQRTCKEHGDTQTQEISALGHVYKNGVCTRCKNNESEEKTQTHTYGSWRTVKEPTCVEAGLRERSCKDGDDTQRETISALGHVYKNSVCTRCGNNESDEKTHTHTYGSWTTVKEPTCTESGLKQRTCVDGEVQQLEIVALGHDYVSGVCTRCHQSQADSKAGEWTTVQEPTCTTDGERQREVNGKTETQVISALGHNFENGVCTRCDVAEGSEPEQKHTYGDWISVKEPTCTEAGERQLLCKDCNEVLTEEISALGHDYKNGVCSRCGSKESEETFVTHTYGEWRTVKEPTCTNAGLKQRICKDGDDTQTETIAALGHDFVSGKCTRCQIAEGSEPVKTHTYGAWKTVKEPTCTATGLRQKICTDCGEVLTEDVAALGHDYVNGVCTRCDAPEEGVHEHTFGEWTTTKDPTCTESGSKQRLCETCSEIETEIIPSLGHDYQNGECDRCHKSDTDVETETHQYGEWRTVKLPTCTESGLRERTCKENDDTQSEEIVALGHNYVDGVCTRCKQNQSDAQAGEWTTVKEPTCTEDGERQREVDGETETQTIVALGHNYVNGACTRCGELESEETLVTHIYSEWKTVKNPTCTEDGSKERICTECNEKQTITLPSLGHNYVDGECTHCGAFEGGEEPHTHTYGEWTNVTEPTCTEEGQRQRVCECGEKQTEAISALGHNFVNNVCTRCHEGESPAKTHTYGAWSIVKEPTCTEAGLKERTCVDGDDTQTVEIAAFGHSYVNGVCTRCGNKQSEGASETHAYGDWKTIKEPTCVEAGIKERICLDCGDIQTEEISALGHKFAGSECSRCHVNKGDIATETHTYGAWRTVKEPTCTVDGIRERTCVDGEVQTEMIAALGHQFVSGMCARCNVRESEVPDGTWETVTEPTCTEAGLRQRETAEGTQTEAISALGHAYKNGVCTRCGAKQNEETSKTHTYGAWETVKEPTCTEAGLKQRVCQDNDDTQTETIAALGHIFVNGVCTRCDKVENSIPPVEHTYGEWVTIKEATCTEAGLKERVCKDNDDTQTQTIAALGHDYINGICTRCGQKQSEEKPVEHTYGDWVTVKEPTCTETGLKQRICTDCGEAQTETISAYGHSYVTHEAKPATCTEIGWEAYTECTRCGETTYQAIPATGHTFGEWTDNRANCEAEGERTRTCSVCGIEDKQTLIAGEHSWNDGIETTEATCTEAGTMTYTCLKCGATKTEEIAALGHDYVEDPDKSKYTVCEGGKKVSPCSRCEDVKTEPLTGAGHNYKDGICTVCFDKQPENAFTLSMDAEGKVDIGQTITVTINLGGKAVKAAGYKLQLTYDQAMLEYVGGEGGRALYEKDGVVTLVDASAANNKVGGTIATLTFTTKTAGTTDMLLSVAEIEEVWLDHSIHDTSSVVKKTAMTIDIGHNYIVDESHSNFSICEGGTKVSVCSVCKDEKTEQLTGASHNYIGTKCTVCGEKKPENKFTVNATTAGNTVTVTIDLGGVVKTSGYTLELTYDTTKLQFVPQEHYEAMAVSENGGVITVIQPIGKNNTTGGTVVTLTFTAKATGEANFTLNVTGILENWKDTSTHDTTYEVVNGKVTIE